MIDPTNLVGKFESLSLQSSTPAAELTLNSRRKVFITSLTLNGLSFNQAQRLALHLDSHIGQWIESGNRVYQKKAGPLVRTFEYIHAKREVYVHLKSKSGGFIARSGSSKITKSIAFTTGQVFVQKVVRKDRIHLFGSDELMLEGSYFEALKGAENIVQIELTGTSGLILEYMSGGNLRRAPKVSRLQRVSYYRQLLNALRQLHGRDLVHNDVKLDNVFLKVNAEGSHIVKLGDFGSVGRTNETGIRTCSPWILSPNRLSGMLNFQEQYVQDPQDDLFAVGVCIYELENRAWPPFCKQAISLFETAEGLTKLRWKMWAVGDVTTRRAQLRQQLQRAENPQQLDLVDFQKQMDPERFKPFQKLALQYIEQASQARKKWLKFVNNLRTFCAASRREQSIEDLMLHLLHPNQRLNAAQALDFASKITELGSN